LVLAGIAIAAPPPAHAACHAFEVAVNPATVAEGGTVTVTVTRDFNANPSSVEVVSVNETAVAGQDFPGVQRTVSMGTETSATFTVATTNDTAPEPAETFRLHLQNAGGCAVNPNFTYASDARVTIQDNDAATATPPPTAAATTPTTRPSTTVASATTTTVAETTTAVTETTVESTSTSDDLALAGDEGEDDDGGGGAAGVLAILAGIVVISGLAYVIYRRRIAPNI
jgi:hypothetical protein